MSKDEIIEQATEQFLKHGYKTITMDEIASELGISKKTLYEHIGNKISLIQESVQYQLNRLQEMYDDILTQNLDAIEEINTIVSKTKNRVNNPEHNTALYQLQKYYTKVYQKIYMSQLSFAKELLKMNLKKGQEQNLYRKEVDPNQFAEIIMITQTKLKCSDFDAQNMNNLNSMSNTHFDLMLRGILTEKGLNKYEQSEFISNEI